MFELATPWWELVARAFLVYAALMLMVRLSGKRTVGQFTPFDLLVVMLLSEGVSNALSGGEESVLGGLILAATLITLNVCVAVASARSSRFQEIVEGAPVLVGRDGAVFDDVLRRQHIGRGELEKALREADCSLEEMQCAFLETDGAFSILKRPKKPSRRTRNGRAREHRCRSGSAMGLWGGGHASRRMRPRGANSEDSLR
ncbi:DUF421 domain-containing protein [Piscinibacter gummiphilus]|nr:YetF domain-containing protein [Piscinibacter gummiphilus]GLS95556.1 DUF421 domain-containing protein [Piscinibacter gummiphilus]